jgi:hypothetical protein
MKQLFTLITFFLITLSVQSQTADTLYTNYTTLDKSVSNTTTITPPVQLSDADIIKQAREPNPFYTEPSPTPIPYETTHMDSFMKREGQAQLDGLSEGMRGFIRTLEGTIIVGAANFIY